MRLPPKRLGTFSTTALALAFLLALSGCDPYPKDPEGSLAQARSGGLKVGAIEAPSWVSTAGEGVSGREVELVRGFAEAMGTEIHWTEGTESQLVPILQAGELHLLIGGLTRDNPWLKQVGVTKPFYKQKVVVCSPDGSPLPKSIKGLVVAVQRDSSLWADVRRHGGIAVFADALDAPPPLVAVDRNDMKREGCADGPVLDLITHKHVMAIPKGENALLMALEGYLNENGL